MNARKVLVWGVVLGSSLIFCTGCRPRRRGDVERYKELIKQLDGKASRLALENSRLRADLAEAQLMIRMVEEKGGVWKQLSEDLKRKLEAEFGHEPGVTVGPTSVTIAGRVLFKSGRYEIRPEGRVLLKKIADVLKDEKEVLRIDGHTDNVKIKYARQRGITSNRHLSAMRALSVIKVLKQNGIDPRRLFLAGYGEHWPVADNETEKGRQRNRRVEIVVLPPRAIAIPTGNAEPIVKPGAKKEKK